MSGTLKGVVKWFNDAKGFGFIEHTSGKDVFVHYSVIEQDGYKSLKDGEEVLYEIKEGPKGLHAAKVSRVNAPEAAAPKAEGKAISYEIPQITGEMPEDENAAEMDSAEASDDESGASISAVE